MPASSSSLFYTSRKLRCSFRKLFGSFSVNYISKICSSAQVQLVICPICREPLTIDETSCKCTGGHEFHIHDRIVDLMPSITDKNLLNEEKHWDNVADQGKMKIMPDRYMNSKVFHNDRLIVESAIIKEWPNYRDKDVCIGEIGCGYGSAISYLSRLEFPRTTYVGSDISIKRMQLARNRAVPSNWDILFVRASVKTPVFKEDSMDIIFSAATLHHVGCDQNIIQWISKSLRKGGLFIVDEPSIKNPIAKVARKLVHDFHTEGERPLLPRQVIEVAGKQDLELVYEKGLNFLTGSLQYLVGILKVPKTVSACAYRISKSIDCLVTSPGLNYNFIQVYKKQ